MAEAEEVIADAARHATVFGRSLWRRYRPVRVPAHLGVADIAPRLNLLLTALFGQSWILRPAPAPAPRTLLHRMFRRSVPYQDASLPATDGSTLWLPDALVLPEADAAPRCMRALALMQAMRAMRGAPQAAHRADDGLTRALLHLFEAHNADADLTNRVPGFAAELRAVRARALASRPPPSTFSDVGRALELIVREVMTLAPGDETGLIVHTPNAMDSLRRAHEQSRHLLRRYGAAARRMEMFHDEWIGRLIEPPDSACAAQWREAEPEQPGGDRVVRSARLSRTPQIRKPADDEDDRDPGAWMVQTSQPQEHAEDPVGMQRSTDRDDSTAAEDFADSLAELPEARLVSAPGRPKEYLLSDSSPPTRRGEVNRIPSLEACRYPEWDFRTQRYRDPGALVHQQPAPEGDGRWVERTLMAHAGMLTAIRRRFEMLRAQRVRLRRQFDGEDIDLDAWIDSHADFRAGLPRTEMLYQTVRTQKRELAVALLVDASGSTDAWVSAQQRIIDVEREALLLVCIALEGLGEPYAMFAFSGEGPDGVWVRSIKDFDERHSASTGLRIAALEPERYTRSGAAIRHVAADLMRQQARHRLLLVLSDGRPNDVDQYEGRYGVEDMRQSVIEAKMQGIFPFCLTVDRQAPSYLPQVFGASHYALLPRSERLPLVLLEWIKRLASS